MGPRVRQCRQSHTERGAAADARAVDTHGAAMQRRDLLDDRQTQAEATVAFRRRAVGLPEPVEDVWQEILGDADAGIGHRNLVTAGRPHAQSRRWSRRPC